MASLAFKQNGSNVYGFDFNHTDLVHYSILIYWAGPFSILGVSGLLFHFYFNFDRNSCEQTVKTLIRRRVLHCLPRAHKRYARLIRVNFECLLKKRGRSLENSLLF